MPQGKKGAADDGIPVLGRSTGAKRQRKQKVPGGTVFLPRKVPAAPADKSPKAASSRKPAVVKEPVVAKSKPAVARSSKKQAGKGKAAVSNGVSASAARQRPPSVTPADETEAVGRQIHNEDFCGNCGIGGGLICCERCPLAFHVLCCNPPLDPDNLPEDEWLCSRCSPRERGPTAYAIADVPEEFASITDRFLRKNPAIFRPPKDIIKPYRDQANKEQRKRQYGHQMWDQDILCYKCGTEPTETQRMRCTHCPLVFHVDCLKEPVTAVVVKGAWMCPNHPERIQSRRKIARLSLREPVEADEELDGEEVAATFIAKVAMERDAMPAGPAVPAVVPEADKRTFAEAMVRMHEDWWSQERVHLAGTGTSSCERSAPDMPVTLALAQDVDSMTPEDRRAAILRLRKLVDADVRESKIARAQVPGPVAVAARAAAPAATSPRYCPDDCVATLRCTCSGEVFFVIKGEDFIIGTGTKAKLDLEALKPPQDPDELHSVILFSERSGNVELVHESAKGSVWLNGTEVTHEDKKSAVLADNSVLEICGLKFAVELSAR